MFFGQFNFWNKSQTTIPALTAIFKECLNRGLIINCTQGNVLRIMPALNVTKKQIDKAMFILDKAIESVWKKT